LLFLLFSFFFIKASIEAMREGIIQFFKDIPSESPIYFSIVFVGSIFGIFFIVIYFISKLVY
jgi:hypothetical protein